MYAVTPDTMSIEQKMTAFVELPPGYTKFGQGRSKVIYQVSNSYNFDFGVFGISNLADLYFL